MKSILMTNLYFERYVGSELHTLEIARLFREKGYDVTVAVFRKAYPLLGEAEGIHIIDCIREPLEKQDYDILFVQHYPVFDYLCTHYELNYKYLIVSKLGPTNSYETLSPCVKRADLIVTISQECAEVISSDIGKDDRIMIIPNCLGEEYFLENAQKGELRRIAVISNHVSEEVLALKDFIPEAEIDYIGLQYTPKRVSPALLQMYDLVITIGRTVPACFAARVPVFVYDYFGGPGYLNENNYGLAEKNNFSGRGFESYSAEELADRILRGYTDNNERLEWLHKKACENHSYKKQFEKLYNRLMACPGERKSMDLYTGLEKEYKKLYSYLTGSSMQLSLKQTSCLYFDMGDGFSEKDMKQWLSLADYPVSYSVKVEKDLKNIRFDPCSQMCKCKILNVTCEGVSYLQCINPANAVFVEESDVFLTTDPQYLFVVPAELVGKNIIIEYKYEILTEEETESYYQKILFEKENHIIHLHELLEQDKGIIANKDEEIRRIQNDLTAVTESTIWKKSEPIRKMMDKIKAK